MVYWDFQVNKFYEASVFICWWKKLLLDSAFNAIWDNDFFYTVKYFVAVNPCRVLVLCHGLKISTREKYIKLFYEKNVIQKHKPANKNEFVILCAFRTFLPLLHTRLTRLRSFVPYVPSYFTCLRALRTLITRRLNFASWLRVP